LKRKQWLPIIILLGSKIPPAAAGRRLTASGWSE
jgi:hypothetical protein